MSTNDQDPLASQFSRHLGELLSKELQIPVYDIDNQLVDQIVDEARQLPKIETKYSMDELRQEVSNWLSMQIVRRPKNAEEATERMRAFFAALEIVKRYEAIIILPGIRGLPIGPKIGLLEIIEPITEDKTLEEHLARMRQEKRVNYVLLSHGKVEFQAYTTTRVRDILEEKLERTFSILSLIMRFDLDVRDCAGIIRSQDSTTVHFLVPNNEINGWAQYHPPLHEELLVRLSSISLQSKSNQIQDKVLRSLQIYGLSRLSHKDEVRFLFVISAFESLLLSKNDRDYLGKSLAEKTAFLLGSDYEQRKSVFKLMKKFYGKRSGLVHGGNADISDKDVLAVEHIFRELVTRVLELSKKYAKMDQKSSEKDKEGLEDYINKLRFS